MSHTSHRVLLNHGRKAGLNTNELYRALSTQPPEAHDHSNRHADGNGFVSDYLQGGQRVYRPVQGSARS
jgi:hypothetical protein